MEGALIVRQNNVREYGGGVGRSEESMAERKPMIFVVDDDESVRSALKRLIRSVGLDVETFASAQEFLRYVPPQGPGCLVLDVRMPGMSGIDLQRMLAARGSKMPVIFITAHEEVVSLAQKAGAVAVLQKPFEEKAFLDAISTALRRKNSGNEKNGNAAGETFPGVW